ncbi:alpha-1,2-mannosyltransferase (Ktr4), glycosyltransferase family 15 protein [Pseudohyphozyma bogoriensis]|nr:alpha-1,2-mannosyltransferase (Ktr4), glycosyltransferase family 15 protein [Pseudohyphozyma bogoriensis]
MECSATLFADGNDKLPSHKRSRSRRALGPAPPLPILVRLSIAAFALLASVILMMHLYPSPWLARSPSLFLRRPPPLAHLATSVPAMEGCQDVKVTTLEARENAAIVLLLREKDLAELLPTLRNFEAKFNANFRYPYVFISSPDAPGFTAQFKRAVTRALPAGAVTEWGEVPEEHWEIPPSMDKQEVRAGFKEQEARGVQYAGREGYHHMCRWYSGLWARHPILAKYDWYWRLEPGVRFYCSVTYDPFRFLSMNNKVYGFVITIVETANTIPTLFSTIKDYAKRKNITPAPALWDFLTKKGEDGKEEYSLCHFWTNFEIGDLRFFRSAEYQDLFNELDQAGGFYKERWGDAPIRSIALGLLSDIDRIHYFEDFAYKHDWFMHCPQRKGLGCDCECPAFDKDHVDIADFSTYLTVLPVRLSPPMALTENGVGGSKGKGRAKTSDDDDVEMVDQDGRDDDQGGDYDDDEEEDEEERAARLATQREKARDTRAGYRALQEEVEGSRKNLIDTTVEDMSAQVEKANRLFKDVKAPSEAILDSRVLMAASDAGALKARQLKLDANAFDTDEFISRLLRFMGRRSGGGRRSTRAAESEAGDEDGDDADAMTDGWTKVGRVLAKESRRIPVMDHMWGPLSVETKEKKQRTQRAQHKPDESERIRPQEIDSGDVQKDPNEPTKMVAEISKILQQEAEGGMPYLKFIINPDSFAQTVENMFYYAFLVKEGHAAIEIEDDPNSEYFGEAMVYRCKPADPEQIKEGAKKQQLVFELTQKVWKDAIETYDITESVIPTRDITHEQAKGKAWH